MTSAFTRILKSEKIVLHPSKLTRRIQFYIEEEVSKKQGMCLDNGWVRPGSIEIRNFDEDGTINTATLSGITEHRTVFIADVFKPAFRETYRCVVENVTQWGLKASFSYLDSSSGLTHCVMNATVVRNGFHISNEIDPISFNVGDHVVIELLGIRCPRGAQSISATGRVVRSEPMFIEDSLHIDPDTIKVVEGSTEDNIVTARDMVGLEAYISDDEDEDGVDKDVDETSEEDTESGSSEDEEEVDEDILEDADEPGDLSDGE